MYLELLVLLNQLVNGIKVETLVSDGSTDNSINIIQPFLKMLN